MNDEESTGIGWFAPDALPTANPWVRLRVQTALSGQRAAWFAQPGTYHAALGLPAAL